MLSVDRVQDYFQPTTVVKQEEDSLPTTMIPSKRFKADRALSTYYKYFNTEQQLQQTETSQRFQGFQPEDDTLEVLQEFINQPLNSAASVTTDEMQDDLNSMLPLYLDPKTSRAHESFEKFPKCEPKFENYSINVEPFCDRDLMGHAEQYCSAASEYTPRVAYPQLDRSCSYQHIPLDEYFFSSATKRRRVGQDELKTKKKTKTNTQQRVNIQSEDELNAQGFFESYVESGIPIYKCQDKQRIRRLLCSRCGKKFRGKSEIVVHVRTHTGERPLKCKHCDRRFAHPSNLRVHERSHSEHQTEKDRVKALKAGSATSAKKVEPSAALTPADK